MNGKLQIPDMLLKLAHTQTHTHTRWHKWFCENCGEFQRIKYITD